MAEVNWKPKILTSHDLSLAPRSLDSLSKKYGATPKEIAYMNDVAWNSTAINEWVLGAGGKEVTPGNFAFLPGNKIYLPPAVIPEPTQPAPGVHPPAPLMSSQILGISTSWWIYGGLALGGFWLYRRGKKKA